MANPKTKRRNTLTLVLFIIYLLALTWLISFKLQFSIPDMTGERVINLIPLLGSRNANGFIRFDEIEVNILAFIPLGIYLCMLRAKWSFVNRVLVMGCLSFAFEALQFIFAIGRADITDVLSNTLGGIIGIGLYVLLSKLLKGRTNTIVNALAAVFTVLAGFLVALLLISHRWVMIR